MTDRIILGNNLSFETDTSKTFLNNNICIIGATGSGKTQFFIHPMLVHSKNTNFVIYDPKRELYEMYNPEYQKRGYATYEINLTNPEKSDVSIGFLSSVSSHTELNSLARRIVELFSQSAYSSADRYWRDASCNMASLGIYYVLSKLDKPTISDFVDFIRDFKLYDSRELINTSIDAFMDAVSAKHPDHPMIAPYNSLKTLPVRTAGCVFSELKTTLSNAFNEDILTMFRNKPELDFEKFSSQKSIMFITSDGRNENINALAALIFETIIKELTTVADRYPDMKLPIPTRLILEDMACGAKLTEFPKEISSFRSKGISSVIVLQSITQLETLYSKAEGTTIITNNDTIVFTGSNDLYTCNEIAQRMNKPLEYVLNMKNDKVAIFRRGSKPVLTARYDIFSDKEFNRILSAYKARKGKKRSDILSDNKTRFLQKQSLVGDCENDKSALDELFSDDRH